MSGRGILRGHKLVVLYLVVAGNLVFSGSADKNVCVWKRHESGIHTWLSVLTGHNGPVKCIAVKEEKLQLENPRERDNLRWIVYTGSLDKSMKVWGVPEHEPQLSVAQNWTTPNHGFELPANGSLSYSSPAPNDVANRNSIGSNANTDRNHNSTNYSHSQLSASKDNGSHSSNRNNSNADSNDNNNYNYKHKQSQSVSNINCNSINNKQNVSNDNDNHHLNTNNAISNDNFTTNQQGSSNDNKRSLSAQ